jgi:hypothetical protein
MTPTRHQLAFASYDPFTDDRIDPTDAERIFAYTELPTCVHDAVARAKRLVDKLDRDALTQRAGELTQMLGDGLVYTATALKDNTERDYAPAQESDCLKAYLEYATHSHLPEQWPSLFGLLALSLAGEITNTLWPSEPFLSHRVSRTGVHTDLIEVTESEEIQRQRVLDAAIEAVRTVGFGEGFKAALHELETKRKNRIRAKTTHKEKEPIFTRYIDWVLALGSTHTYRYQSHAEQDFLKELEQKQPDLYRLVSAKTYETMRTRLKKHCIEQKQPYPFPQKS